jgi:hypothetical protein
VIAVVVLSLSLYIPNVLPVAAQNKLKCGDIFEDEFEKFPESRKVTIDMSPGEILEVIGTPAGETLSFTITIWDKGGKVVGMSDPNNTYWVQPSPAPKVTTPALSASGTYEILVGNGETSAGGGRRYYEVVGFARNGGVGAYTLSMRCTRKDRTVIEPGAGKSEVTDPVAPPRFSGVGFPGLPPVDFSKANKLKLPRSGEVEGEINPANNEIYSFTFNGRTGQNVELAFNRISGNLNLGVVVLSADNKVLFYGGLVASEGLTTRLKLPADGQYTIGVFKVDLLPPAEPQPTAFQVSAKVG